MPVTFQVVGNLADFGNDPRAGVKVHATASPGVKVGDVAVHSNEPETVVTDAAGAFTLELVSLPGVWYTIRTPYSNAINTVRLAGYTPDVEDPTTGTEFPALTVINLRTVMDEDPTPGYDVLAYLDDGALGAEEDARIAADAALDGRVAGLEVAPPAHTHPLADITATGTPSASTYLRGDGSWSTPAGGGGGGAVDSVNGETGVVVLDAADVGADPAGTAAFLVGALTIPDSPDDIGAATAAQGAKADTAVQPAALAAHEADTTAVHGIADTAALVVTTDPRLSDARTPTAHTHDDRYFTETEADGRFVRTVNGTGPDGSGNVTVAGGGGGVTDHGALTGLGDDDHAQYALADGTRGAFAAPLGADDNYVTDAEKAALHAHSNKAALDLVSGTNTGDQTLPTWSTIAGKPAVVAAGIDAAAARTAIGAGTSSIVVGTGAGDAKAGNYQPTAANISDSTTTGRALLTAADAAAARTTLALGTAATTASTAYATTAQGAKADTAVQPARTITAGTGLTGGGDLSANRTLAVAYGTTSTTATVGNDSRVTGAIQASITDAKGDIIAATAADTVARVAVGSAGDSLTPDSSAGTGVAWAIPLLKVASTASTTIAPVLADHGKYQRLTAATAVTITLPSDATQAFPIGSYLLYKATAAGLATFVAGSSATLEDATPSAVMRAEGSLVQATKVAANTWTLDGDLACA